MEDFDDHFCTIISSWTITAVSKEDSEANASELLENIDDISPLYYS